MKTVLSRVGEPASMREGRGMGLEVLVYPRQHSTLHLPMKRYERQASPLFARCQGVLYNSYTIHSQKPHLRHSGSCQGF